MSANALAARLTTAKEGDLSMHSQQSPGWRPPPPQPPRKSWPRRHKIWSVVLTTIGVLVAMGVVGAIISPPKSSSASANVAAVSTTAPAASTTSSAPAPAPVPSPSGNITGSCDVSLSDSIYGQNYLTASVTATNTGNIGTIVRIKVAWPLQGFAPITKVKRAHTAAGSTNQVQFRAPVTVQQVSQFQDMQLAASGDPCHYHADIAGTFGTAH